jgi:hypothetical protein
MKVFEFDHSPIWERQSFDTPKSIAALQQYLNLPSHNRSIAVLHSVYQQRSLDDKKEGKTPSVPSNSLLTLQRWGSQYMFRKRARAFDDDQSQRLSEKRAALKEAQINDQLASEQQQVEEYRNSCLTVGRDIVSFAQTVLDLITTVPKDMQDRALVDKDFDRLSKITTIFKNIVPGIASGTELCAQSLGIAEALAALNENRSRESAYEK